MSSAAVDLPTITTVDLRLLSQSDLYALSLSSSPSSIAAAAVVPQINRSVFNESAGSRKQTFSRLRLAPRNPHSSVPLPKPSPSDPESAENSRIVSILKTLFADGGDGVVVEVPENQIPGEKRKRGRPRRNPNPNSSPSFGAGGENVTKGIFVNGNNRANVIKGILVNGNNVSEVESDRERVNEKGVEVDLGELARLDDPYRGELERRSVGLRTEEEFLGFLGGLSGQWGSRRRKRRVVDAGEFGDALPRGWKLILSLKKKEGRVWVHVRRYIRFNYVAYTVRFSVMSF